MNTPFALSPVQYQILLSLSPGPLHGYAILQAIAALNDGAYEPAPGNLYTNLKRLRDANFIESAGTPAGDPRQRPYRLTASGLLVLRQETARWDRLVSRAKTTAMGVLA